MSDATIKRNRVLLGCAFDKESVNKAQDFDETELRVGLCLTLTKSWLCDAGPLHST
jgi:hypothetical protein